jgi:hypothetical protein
MGDTFYNPDPLTAGTLGDVFMNTAGGDAWFDVITWWYQSTAWDILNTTAQNTAWDILNLSEQDIAWDILNVFLQNTSWDILNENHDDTAWSIFAQVLYYLGQIYAKKICFDYRTASGEYLGVPIGQACSVKEPIKFNVQVANKIKYTFRPQTVHGAGIENFEERN